MSKADGRSLTELAASVADGEPVNWGLAEVDIPQPERRLVRHLRLVESIATLHRTVTDDSSAVFESSTEEADGYRWGRLIVGERIGEGTSGEVYRAWDSALHRHVALKLLRDDSVGAADAHSRTLDEARRMARLRHENVVQVYGAEQHDGRVGLWMELVRGESLEQIVLARGPFGAREAAGIGQDLCAALAAVHAAGLLHRDIKAQNVIRENGGRVVLMDFGTGEELRHRAGTNRLVGTPLYLAPELFRGEAASVQSDVYSLGVLLFYLVTGEFPVMAGSLEQLARAHAEGRLKHLRDLRPDIPEAFIRIVEQALRSNPADRHRTVGQFAAALRESAVAPIPVTARVAAPVPRKVAWLPYTVVATALVVAILAIIVWTGSVGTTKVPLVAVLPFVDASNPAVSTSLTDVLTQQMISTLGQIDTLRVISNASVERFRNADTPLGSIGKALGADAVLSPTVRTFGANADPTRVRVDARLVAAGTGALLWEGSIEREIGDTLGLQSELARKIAEQLHVAVKPPAAGRLARSAATSQAAAEAYFKGLQLLNQLSVERMPMAIEAFQRAADLDPQYAPAHVGLARSYINLGFLGASGHMEARARALAAVNRALASDRDSPEAQSVLADLKFYYDWDWPGAEEAYRRAVELNPSSSYARSQYARYLAASRRFDEAVHQAQRAALLDPLSASAVSTTALMFYYKRDHTAAVQSAERALALDPESAGVHYVLARIHAALGHLPEAIAANERAIALSGQPAPSWRAYLIALQVANGAETDVVGRIDQLAADVANRGERLSTEHVAYIYLAAGDRAKALRLLEQAVDDHSPELLWLGVDPRVDALRNEPRFQALLSRLGMK
jgi:eukaryotic-like serine/threonine-protein kinase